MIIYHGLDAFKGAGSVDSVIATLANIRTLTISGAVVAANSQ